VASTIEHEAFLLGNLFPDSDINQTTLAANSTADIDQLLCIYDHRESLVNSLARFHSHGIIQNYNQSLNSQTNFSGCYPTYDKVLCWPPTPFNSFAVQPCFKEFAGLQYDSNEGELCFGVVVAMLVNKALNSLQQ